jgi:hypothetical protein
MTFRNPLKFFDQFLDWRKRDLAEELERHLWMARKQAPQEAIFGCGVSACAFWHTTSMLYSDIA